MPESVAAVIEREPEPGDVWILNDPYPGGTHLPDITLVSPLDVDGDDPRLRGHARAPLRRRRHAPRLDAGRTPATLWQEGLIIPPCGSRRRRVRRAARADPRQRAHARHPPRRPARADRRRTGSPGGGCAELVERRGRETVDAAFAEVLAYAERRTREALRDAARRHATRPSGEIEGDGVTDDDIPIARRRHGRRRRAARSTSPAPPTRSPATSTARSRSRARPATSRCGCCCPATCRPTRAPTRRSRSTRPRARSSTRSRPPRWWPATSRPRSAIADTVLAALAQAVDLPAAGPGHDEQPDHRRPRLDLLRDDRRRPGRELAAATARRACTSA